MAKAKVRVEFPTAKDLDAKKKSLLSFLMTHGCINFYMSCKDNFNSESYDGESLTYNGDNTYSVILHHIDPDSELHINTVCVSGTLSNGHNNTYKITDKYIKIEEFDSNGETRYKVTITADRSDYTDCNLYITQLPTINNLSCYISTHDSIDADSGYQLMIPINDASDDNSSDDLSNNSISERYYDSDNKIFAISMKPGSNNRKVVFRDLYNNESFSQNHRIEVVVKDGDTIVAQGITTLNHPDAFLENYGYNYSINYYSVLPTGSEESVSLDEFVTFFKVDSTTGKLTSNVYLENIELEPWYGTGDPTSVEISLSGASENIADSISGRGRIVSTESEMKKSTSSLKLYHRILSANDNGPVNIYVSDPRLQEMQCNISIVSSSNISDINEIPFSQIENVDLDFNIAAGKIPFDRDNSHSSDIIYDLRTTSFTICTTSETNINDESLVKNTYQDAFYKIGILPISNKTIDEIKSMLISSSGLQYVTNNNSSDSLVFSNNGNDDKLSFYEMGKLDTQTNSQPLNFINLSLLSNNEYSSPSIILPVNIILPLYTVNNSSLCNNLIGLLYLQLCKTDGTEITDSIFDREYSIDDNIAFNSHVSINESPVSDSGYKVEESNDSQFEPMPGGLPSIDVSSLITKEIKFTDESIQSGFIKSEINLPSISMQTFTVTSNNIEYTFKYVCDNPTEYIINKLIYDGSMHLTAFYTRNIEDNIDPGIYSSPTSSLIMFNNNHIPGSANVSLPDSNSTTRELKFDLYVLNNEDEFEPYPQGIDLDNPTPTEDTYIVLRADVEIQPFNPGILG